jgi:hypothetical protein
MSLSVDQAQAQGIKIIFLDIDGVLCLRGEVFEGDLVMNLRSVVEATGAQIVLSSDWRRDRASVELCRQKLQAYGLDFIDCTPSLSPKILQRPKEILQWKNQYCDSGRDISAWIAIDDRNLPAEKQGDELQGHFVRTNIRIGLDRSVARQCIQLMQQLSAESSKRHSLNASARVTYSADGFKIPNGIQPQQEDWADYYTAADGFRRRFSDASARISPRPLSADGSSAVRSITNGQAYGGYRAAGNPTGESYTPKRMQSYDPPISLSRQPYRPVWTDIRSTMPEPSRTQVYPATKSDYPSNTMISPRDYLLRPKSSDRLPYQSQKGDLLISTTGNFYSVWDPALGA